jgi:hypothetical protein
MAVVLDVLIRQRVVTEFLTAEGPRLPEIHQCLRSMYGDDAVDVSSVRCWVHCFKSSVKDIYYRSHSC